MDLRRGLLDGQMENRVAGDLRGVDMLGQERETAKETASFCSLEVVDGDGDSLVFVVIEKGMAERVVGLGRAAYALHKVYGRVVLLGIFLAGDDHLSEGLRLRTEAYFIHVDAVLVYRNALSGISLTPDCEDRRRIGDGNLEDAFRIGHGGATVGGCSHRGIRNGLVSNAVADDAADEIARSACPDRQSAHHDGDDSNHRRRQYAPQEAVGAVEGQ